MGMGVDIRHQMAKRAAQEIKDGMIVNLGIGIPSLVSNYLPADLHVMFHAENGILGMGPAPKIGEEDAMLCNAGGFPVTIVPGASYFDSALAFGMIRGGHLDITILGGLEVSEQGDLANWMIPGKKIPGIGGGMELAEKANKVIVLMSHTNKYGEPKIVKECTLPLTAKKCVDLIITDMAVIEVTTEGLVLKELMDGFTAEAVQDKTGAPLTIANDVKMIS